MRNACKHCEISQTDCEWPKFARHMAKDFPTICFGLKKIIGKVEEERSNASSFKITKMRVSLRETNDSSRARARSVTKVIVMHLHSSVKTEVPGGHAGCVTHERVKRAARAHVRPNALRVAVQRSPPPRLASFESGVTRARSPTSLSLYVAAGRVPGSRRERDGVLYPRDLVRVVAGPCRENGSETRATIARLGRPDRNTLERIRSVLRRAYTPHLRPPYRKSRDA